VLQGRACAQSVPKVQLFVGTRLTAYADSTPYSDILKRWSGYLNATSDSARRLFWDEAEAKSFKRPDLAGSFLFLPVGNRFFNQWQPVVIEIDSVEGAYLLHTAYVSFDTDLVSQALYGVHEVLAVRDPENHWRFRSTLEYRTKGEYSRRKIGMITYIYPHSHRLNLQLARRSLRLVDSLSKQFGFAPPSAIQYYLTDNLDELQNLIGAPYALGLSPAFADWEDHRLFSSQGSEYYPHELAHAVFGDVKSRFLSEGIATFIGGATAKDGSLRNSIARSEDELRQVGNLGLDSLMKQMWVLRSQDVFYVVGGMTAAIIIKLSGRQGLKNACAYTNAELLHRLETLLGKEKLSIDDIVKEYRSISD
jgi:hypothetical protein